MKNKITQSIPALLAVLAIGFRYFSQWCILTNLSCYGTWVHHMYDYITSPVYFFSLYFLPIAIILIFVSRSVFNSWLKFAVWGLLLSFVYIANTHVTSSAFLDLFPFYRDDAAREAGGAFAIISLILIIWKFFTLRRASRKV